MGSWRRPGGGHGSAAVALACGLLVALGMPGFASAEEPQRLWQGGENCADVGMLVNGECGFMVVDSSIETVTPRGIAANPVSGHVFVADQSNSRVVELDPWGQFVKAWGWGVRNGQAELQSCTAQTGCLKGLPGSGPGQFLTGVQGMAVDSEGYVYVGDRNNHRIQKFDPTAGIGEDEAAFVLTFGGSVNQTTGGDVCTQASGNTCGTGIEGNGNGEFGAWPVSSLVAVGPSDEIYVGDTERVQVFGKDGGYLKSIPLAGETVHSLAVDSAGGLYLSYLESGSTAKPGVRRIGPSGEAICTALSSDPDAAATDNPTAIAVDPAGGFHVVQGRRPGSGMPPSKVVSFGADCEEEERFEPTDFESSTGIAASTVTEAGLSALYLAHSVFADSFIRAYYPPPDKAPPFSQPPQVPPIITDQYAVAASSGGATVRALINPRFWADTSYYVEYGTGECSQGGCTQKASFPGVQLGAGIVGNEVTTAPVFLAGLSPDTTYHYRFVSQSSGGGPVSGVGGTEEDEGLEASFTTFPLPGEPNLSCPNQTLRLGASAALPDCRAYEMVSPLDKGDEDIQPLSNGIKPTRVDQAIPSGEKFTYSTARPFAGAVSAPWSSQYIAARTGGGWASQNISPPRNGSTFYEGSGLSRESTYRAFSEDLCNGWLVHDVDVELAPGAVSGYPNLYRRKSCDASPGYEPLSVATPLAPAPKVSEYEFAVQGFSADGSHTVFAADAKLTADASTAKTEPRPIYQLYVSSEGGGPRLVSVLPSNSAASVDSSAGTAQAGKASDYRYDSVHHAVSGDASRIYWSSADKLYLRINPLAPAGSCAEAGKACTIAVSGPVSANAAHFWGATPDGATALFGVAESSGGGEALYLYDAVARKAEQIAKKAQGVMGASEDLARIYLASAESLDGGAQAGSPNLYLYEEEDFRFVMELSSLDLFGNSGSVATATGPLAELPSQRSSRVSSDGTRAAFASAAASPDGYDNSDASSGEPDTEVYLYDASAEGDKGRLACVSCNPTGARPSGQRVATVSNDVELWAAAQLPGWETQLYPTRALSTNGKRLFFESFEALVLADTNNAKDVYEWEATGEGDCDSADPTHNPASAGCVRLISSGQNSQDSEFRDASSDGSDVFFTTRSRLVAADPGLVDIYDARIGGGFPEAEPRAECEGEGCQHPASPPQAQTPASSAYRGPGNLRDAKPASCDRDARRAKRLSARAKRIGRQASQIASDSPRRAKRMRESSVRLAAKADKLAEGARNCRAGQRKQTNASRGTAR